MLTSAAVTASLREREHLVERRQRVAHAAFGRPRHQRQRGVVDLHVLASGDLRAARGSRRTAASFSSKTCDRDWMVAGTDCSSVVAIMNFTYGGGSSIDLSSASNAFFDSRWTSSMMKIL